MKRDSNLTDIRPIIKSAIINSNMSFDEQFQNATLRPVIALQNNLLIEVFKNYIVKRKNVFYELSSEKQVDYIDHAIHKDMKFRNSIKGMIIGQFTTEEYSKYITNSSALNKRMMNLVMNRLIDQLQLFQKEFVLFTSKTNVS